MTKGTVKWFDQVRGYGFIETKPKCCEDVFVHYSAITNEGKYKTLNEGDIVEFDIIPDRKGPRAENVVVLKEDDIILEEKNTIPKEIVLSKKEKGIVDSFPPTSYLYGAAMFLLGLILGIILQFFKN